MNIVFMGTPEFACPCLNALLQGKHQVLGVFTQPDKPKGRGYTLTPPPVKEVSLTHNIPVYQPTTLRNGEVLAIIDQLNPDIIVVVAYGKILPREILERPKYGCINVHASLLPQYRGAAPIQWAVLKGETESGVTVMQMDVGLDTGDMLLKKALTIDPDETAGELHDRLSVLGAEALTEALTEIEEGRAKPEKQQDDESTYAKMLDKSLCKLDLTQSAQQMHNQIRGLSPWPTAVLTLNGKPLKVYQSTLVEGAEPPKGTLTVTCGDGGLLRLMTVQTEGRKRMSDEDFLKGYKAESFLFE